MSAFINYSSQFLLKLVTNEQNSQHHTPCHPQLPFHSRPLLHPIQHVEKFGLFAGPYFKTYCLQINYV